MPNTLYRRTTHQGIGLRDTSSNPKKGANVRRYKQHWLHGSNHAQSLNIHTRYTIWLAHSVSEDRARGDKAKDATRSMNDPVTSWGARAVLAARMCAHKRVALSGHSASARRFDIPRLVARESPCCRAHPPALGIVLGAGRSPCVWPFLLALLVATGVARAQLLYV